MSLPLDAVAALFVVLIVSLSVHEAAHAWTADRLGDPTARLLGRLTVNPLKHIDVIGTVVFPLLAIISGLPILGWAKPVPVNPNNLREPRRDFAVVAVAGPISNLLLAMAAAIVLKVMIAAGAGPSFGLMVVARANVLLAVFNLLPVPPLDGGNVLAGIVPESIAPTANFVGVVLTGIKPVYFQHIYDFDKSLRNQSFALLRSDSTFLVRHPNPEIRSGQKHPGKKAMVRDRREGGGDTTVRPALSTGAKAGARRGHSELSAVVDVAVAEASALANWQYRAMLIGVGAILTLICSLLLIYALNNKFAQLAASKAALSEREARLAENAYELEQANLRVDRAINSMGQGLAMSTPTRNYWSAVQAVSGALFISAGGGQTGRDLSANIRIQSRERDRSSTTSTNVSKSLVETMNSGQELVLVMEVGDGRTFNVTNRPTEDGGWVSTRRGHHRTCRERAGIAARTQHVARGGREHPGNADRQGSGQRPPCFHQSGR